MKIFIVNITSEFGSTGKIAQILKDGYKANGHDVTICYGQQKVKDRNKEGTYLISNKFENAISVIGQRVLGFPGMGCYFSTQRFLKHLSNEKPDIVHLLNIHGYYLDEFALLNYLKKNNIKTIYTMCDEYPFTGKCGFAFECGGFRKDCKGCKEKKSYPTSWFFNTSSWFFEKKKKCYDGFSNIVFAGCGYVVNRAKESTLLQDKRFEYVGEPIEMDKTFIPRDVSELRCKLNIPSENKVLLTVAVLSNERKGGQYFIDLCNKMQGMDGYSFVYVGYNTDKYESIAPANMIRIPYVESLETLAEYFSLADVFVATTLADTVPNAVINSLACGTPVCAFNIGGMSSIRISDPSIIKATPTGDVEMLLNSVLSFDKKTRADIKRNREAIYKDFSASGVIDSYLRIIESFK